MENRIGSMYLKLSPLILLYSQMCTAFKNSQVTHRKTTVCDPTCPCKHKQCQILSTMSYSVSRSGVYLPQQPGRFLVPRKLGDFGRIYTDIATII